VTFNDDPKLFLYVCSFRLNYNFSSFPHKPIKTLSATGGLCLLVLPDIKYMEEAWPKNLPEGILPPFRTKTIELGMGNHSM
jgi:hypothetical protein